MACKDNQSALSMITHDDKERSKATFNFVVDQIYKFWVSGETSEQVITSIIQLDTSADLMVTKFMESSDE